MGVYANWDDESNDIVHVVFVDPWDWDDYSGIVNELEQMLDSVSHKVALVLDFSKGGGLPSGALHHFRERARNPHKNRGQVIVIGANRVIKMIGGVLEQIFPMTVKSIRFMSSYEEAKAYVREQAV